MEVKKAKTAKNSNRNSWQHHIDKTDQFAPLVLACYLAIAYAEEAGVFQCTIGPNEFDFSDEFKKNDPNGVKGCAIIMLVKRFFRSPALGYKVLKLSTNKFPIQIEW